MGAAAIHGASTPWRSHRVRGQRAKGVCKAVELPEGTARARGLSGSAAAGEGAAAEAFDG